MTTQVMTFDDAAAMGLSADEWALIQERLGAHSQSMRTWYLFCYVVRALLV